MNNKSAGRPNDKNLYIDALMSNINVSDENNNEDIVKALTKLNAKELVTLNTYIAKQNKLSVDQAISLLPTSIGIPFSLTPGHIQASGLSLVVLVPSQLIIKAPSLDWIK